jgi:hypothetical protein
MSNLNFQYVHRNLPTQALNPTELWSNYPHIPLAGPLKFYYLTQTAFYIHQVLILNAEARRKDHVQMMTHHVLTIFLIVMSYFCNFTRIGCLIMVLMDWNDIFLPVSCSPCSLMMQTQSAIPQIGRQDVSVHWFIYPLRYHFHLVPYIMVRGTSRSIRHRHKVGLVRWPAVDLCGLGARIGTLLL